MKCVICKNGETKKGTTTISLQRGDTTIVFKGVPAQVCENCGEAYLDDEVSGRLLELAEQAINKGAEVEVLRYAA
jgi:YgiT-type zinc finger domain-containing protein